jgi:osmoprotectant transport system ATP-binding protein
MGIVFKNVVKQYPNTASPAVDNVSLDIQEGEFIVFLGPSGCGKTTLLKMVNKLYDTTSGTIEIDGEDIRKVQTEQLRRGIGYVIQQNGLFPHMTIESNIAVVPRLLKW